MTRPNISQSYFSKTLAGVWFTCCTIASLIISQVGCGNQEPAGSQAEDSSPAVRDSNITRAVPSFGSLDLDQDPFEHSSTKDSQLAVVNALFSKVEGYRIPGIENHLPDALFEDIRMGYFGKAEGIDDHVRREYHTFTHALDVMITTHAILRGGGGVFLKKHEQSSLVLAALGHDILHTGVNNGFLLKIKHPLVEEFGPDGIQEKRSATHLLKLIDKHEILAPKAEPNSPSNDIISESRSMIEQSILWTDMKRHGDLMKEVSGRMDDIQQALSQARKAVRVSDFNSSKGATDDDVAAGVRAVDFLDVDARILIGALILHCADVSNPTKEWDVCERWSVLVMNEFFSQGDVERKQGHQILMNCDRDTVSIPKSQVGFGQFVIRNLFELLSQISRTSGEKSLRRFEANFKRWQDLAKQEAADDKPYKMTFRPPSREGGWLGELRKVEQ